MDSVERMMRKENKKAQVTIFIIIAIVLVAAIIIIFYPQIKQTATDLFVPMTPAMQIQSCLEEPLEVAVETISAQGGSMNPENAIMYQDDNIEYLCYTNEYYQTCSIQQPLLRKHIEGELEQELKDDAEICTDALKEELERAGYSVTDGETIVSVDIEPEAIVLSVSGFSFSKEETGERYEQFEVEKRSKLYELIMLTTSVMSSEAIYGDTDITTYMNYYTHIKLEKYKQQDGSKIFIMTNRQTEDRFQFATRSLSWPPGYGF
jgi:hypothetical protein